jgi:thymidine kinase
MPKLYFYYSAMNAGKTTTLLQSSFNYKERGMTPILFVPDVIGDTIRSRIGLEETAIPISRNFDFEKYMLEHSGDCILVDEAQFLTREQVRQLGRVVGYYNTPVLCYGLRTDFLGEPFEGSKYLLALADDIVEIKTICSCGKKATMNIRFTDGNRVYEGNQIEIEGNVNKYVAVCRKCYDN